MAAPATSKGTIKKNTIDDMKKLGVYSPEYNMIIDIYAGLWEQYYRLMKAYDTGRGYKYATKTGGEGVKRSPLVATIEAIRRDILAYSDRLCLNPKAMGDGRLKKTESMSKLEELLMEK